MFNIQSLTVEVNNELKRICKCIIKIYVYEKVWRKLESYVQGKWTECYDICIII